MAKSVIHMRNNDMKNAVLYASLLCFVGCASVQTMTPNVESLPVVMAEDGEADLVGIQTWIPGIFEDLFETIDADIGTGYGFGAHFALTNFARVGIFDHADFGIVGIERPIFEGTWVCPLDVPAGEGDLWDSASALDLSAKFGVGFGMSLELHTWEVIDLF
jgi:hypothetical protein